MENKLSIIHAPTGFGKTVVALSALAPFIKAGYQLLIFIRTKSQIFKIYLPDVAEVAKDQFTIIPIIGKENLCLNPSLLTGHQVEGCYNSKCPHYQRFHNQRMKNDPKIILEHHFSSSNYPSSLEDLKTALSDYGCPFYILKSLAPIVNIIVTTHSFLCHPKLRSTFFNNFLAGFTNKIILIDELHNIGPQILDTLYKTDIQKAHQLLPHDEWKKILIPWNDEHSLLRKPRVNFNYLQRLISNKFSNITKNQDTITFLMRILEFLGGTGEIWFRKPNAIVQLNPFPERIFEFLTHFDRVVGMSGSLHPIPLYRKYFGLDRYNFRVLEIPLLQRSAFNAVLEDNRFTSRYTDRSEQLYRYVAQAICRLHEINIAHTLVVAPSYVFLDEIVKQLRSLQPDDELYIEPRQKYKALPKWLNELKYLSHALVCGVSKGKLAEGLELVNDQGHSLITMVIIAGLPYCPTSPLSNLLKSIYSERWGPSIAEELMLKLPMIQSVQQASGRGIRSSNDYCSTIILDHRGVYDEILPSCTVYRDFTSLIRALQKFYFDQQNEAHFGK